MQNYVTVDSKNGKLLLKKRRVEKETKIKSDSRILSFPTQQMGSGFMLLDNPSIRLHKQLLQQVPNEYGYAFVSFQANGQHYRGCLLLDETHQPYAFYDTYQVRRYNVYQDNKQDAEISQALADPWELIPNWTRQFEEWNTQNHGFDEIVGNFASLLQQCIYNCTIRDNEICCKDQRWNIHPSCTFYNKNSNNTRQQSPKAVCSLWMDIQSTFQQNDLLFLRFKSSHFHEVQMLLADTGLDQCSSWTWVQVDMINNNTRAQWGKRLQLQFEPVYSMVDAIQVARLGCHKVEFSTATEAIAVHPDAPYLMVLDTCEHPPHMPLFLFTRVQL